MFRKSHDLLIAADMVGGLFKIFMGYLAWFLFRRFPWSKPVYRVLAHVYSSRIDG